jgi:Zn-dependent protease with chaperone function
LPPATDAARRAARAYRVWIALTAGALLLALGVIGVALADFSVRPRPEHLVSVLGLAVALPSANPAAITLLVLATLGIAVVVAIARGVVTVGRSHRQLQRRLPELGPLTGASDVTVLASDGVHAFCAGLLRPRIYVSAGAVRRLGDDELAAVIAHERMHRVRRDPLRIVTTRLLGEALFFVPPVRVLARRYDTLAEIAADDHALAAVGGDTSVLAAAMLAFDGGVAPERADHILGVRADWSLPLGLVGVAAAGLVALALLVWQLGRHAVLQSTLALPFASSAPCVVVLALVPAAALALGAWASRRF